MEKYKCIKSFRLPIFDKDGFATSNIGTVKEGSMYEYDIDYIGESDIRMYKEDGDDDFGWIDITKKTLREYFIRVE